MSTACNWRVLEELVCVCRMGVCVCGAVLDVPTPVSKFLEWIVLDIPLTAVTPVAASHFPTNVFLSTEHVMTQLHETM